MQIEPELRARPKEGAEREGSLGTDGTLALDDLVDGGTRDAGALGEFDLRELEAVEEFELQNAPGGGREDGLLFAIHGMGIGLNGSR